MRWLVVVVALSSLSCRSKSQDESPKPEPYRSVSVEKYFKTEDGSAAACVEFQAKVPWEAKEDPVRALEVRIVPPKQPPGLVPDGHCRGTGPYGVCRVERSISDLPWRTTASVTESTSYFGLPTVETVETIRQECTSRSGAWREIEPTIRPVVKQPEEAATLRVPLSAFQPIIKRCQGEPTRDTLQGGMTRFMCSRIDSPPHFIFEAMGNPSDLSRISVSIGVSNKAIELLESFTLAVEAIQIANGGVKVGTFMPEEWFDNALSEETEVRHGRLLYTTTPVPSMGIIIFAVKPLADTAPSKPRQVVTQLPTMTDGELCGRYCAELRCAIRNLPGDCQSHCKQLISQDTCRAMERRLMVCQIKNNDCVRGCREERDALNHCFDECTDLAVRGAKLPEQCRRRGRR